MADLIAQGTELRHRWRRALDEGREVIVGRSAALWATPWDEHVSRNHAAIRWEGGHLYVRKLPDARNPIFFDGREVEQCVVGSGQNFVIGSTTFTVTDERVAVTVDAPLPLTEQTYSTQYLKRIRFRNADQRIAVLSQLPDIISGASSDSELQVRLINVLLAGVPRASAAAIIVADSDADPSQIDVLHWDRRLVTGHDFQPSASLIRQAAGTGESIVHVWREQSDRNVSKYTVVDDVDWAFATPVSGDACRGWVIYVAGKFIGSDTPSSSPVTDPSDLRDDVKFTELAAATLGSLREIRLLERRQANLGQFFSPVVLEAIVDQDPEIVLAPRETNVSVLFCDLRGFSRTSEAMADDLMGLLNRVSRALGVTTRYILTEGGVVGDFHGDASMGFWGWPFAQPDAAERACRAALGIRAKFETAARQEGHPLCGFRMGIGIATGSAVAGKIGTIDQVKVTVFGPVVNLASRLETLTDQIRTPILIDQSTARSIRESTSPDVARVRRVAVVKPYGLRHSLEVSELLPPESQFPLLTAQHIAAYEEALDSLLSGDWEAAFQLLHKVPAEDRVKDFLTVLIAQHNRTAPDGWNGVIPIPQK